MPPGERNNAAELNANFKAPDHTDAAEAARLDIKDAAHMPTDEEKFRSNLERMDREGRDPGALAQEKVVLDDAAMEQMVKMSALFKEKGLNSLADIKDLLDARDAGVVGSGRSVEEISRERRGELRLGLDTRIKNAGEAVKPLWNRIKSGTRKIGELARSGASKVGEIAGKGMDVAVAATTAEGRQNMTIALNEKNSQMFSETIGSGIDAMDRAGEAIGDKFTDKKAEAKAWGRARMGEVSKKLDTSTKPIRKRAGEIGQGMLRGIDATVSAANSTVGAIDRGAGAVGAGLRSGMEAAIKAPDVITGAAGAAGSALMTEAGKAVTGAERMGGEAIKWMGDKKDQVKGFGPRIKTFFNNQIDGGLDAIDNWKADRVANKIQSAESKLEVLNNKLAQRNEARMLRQASTEIRMGAAS